MPTTAFIRAAVVILTTVLTPSRPALQAPAAAPASRPRTVPRRGRPRRRPVSRPRRPRVGEHAYERWIKPPPLRPAERRALRQVRHWGHSHGLRFTYDPRLSRTARALLSTVPASSSQRINIDRARRRAQRLGWTDGQLAAVGLRVPRGADFGAALRHELEREISHLDVNRLGLAVQTQRDETVALLLLSRHLVSLLPVPAWVRLRAHLGLGGIVAGPRRRPVALTAVLSYPDGHIERHSLGRGERRFDITLDAGPTPGVLRAQILIDRGRGPEVAATFPVGVAANPWGNEAPLPHIDDDLESTDPEAALTALVLSVRDSQGLEPLAQSAALAEVARSHAVDMRDHGFFAHVSPTTGALTDRLQRRGIRYTRALENIGSADSVEAILRAWLDSPSHRANLLDPEVTTFGIGVATQHDGSRTRLFAVAVLVRLADHGADAELAARARRELNEARAHLGLPALQDSPALDALAARHCREIAGGSRPVDISPIHGRLVDTVFRNVDVSEAAADVYLTNSVDVVQRSAHLRETFDLAGIGVHRDPSRRGPQLWVTVIYASR